MLLETELTGQIIKAFYTVYNELGYGFLEKVYQNAMCYELRSMGLYVEPYPRVNVEYKGVLVGEYFPDIIVHKKIIVELKAAECMTSAFEAQLLNYLRATDQEVGLLLNFGKKPSFIRKVHMNT